jgi:8-oxo-dGTP pyrophosphatase MutT (NUDIX family)
VSGPLSDTPESYPVTSTDIVFHGAVWNVRQDVIDYPGGSLSRHFVDHPGAACVVAIDESDNVVLLRQYRHPVGLRNIEIPAGLLDIPGEDPLVCAKRELAEEAGLAAHSWTKLMTLNVSPGGSNEIIHIFLAEDLTEVPTDFVKTGEEADMTIHRAPLSWAVDACFEGLISNQIAVTALLAAHVSRR